MYGPNCHHDFNENQSIRWLWYSKVDQNANFHMIFQNIIHLLSFALRVMLYQYTILQCLVKLIQVIGDPWCEQACDTFVARKSDSFMLYSSFGTQEPWKFWLSNHLLTSFITYTKVYFKEFSQDHTMLLQSLTTPFLSFSCDHALQTS